MPKYCYNRPNRKKRRTFTGCDCVRICREALLDESGINRIHLLALVAKGLGFSHICLTEGQYHYAATRAGLDKVPSYTDKIDNFIDWVGFVKPTPPDVPVPVRGTITLPKISLNKAASIVAATLLVLGLLKKVIDTVTTDKKSVSCYSVDELIISSHSNCKSLAGFIVDELQEL